MISSAGQCLQCGLILTELNGQGVIYTKTEGHCANMGLLLRIQNNLRTIQTQAAPSRIYIAVQ